MEVIAYLQMNKSNLQEKYFSDVSFLILYAGILFTNHVLAGVGCMQVHSLCEEQKRELIKLPPTTYHLTMI